MIKLAHGRSLLEGIIPFKQSQKVIWVRYEKEKPALRATVKPIARRLWGVFMNKVRSLFHIVDTMEKKVRKANFILCCNRQRFTILEDFLIETQYPPFLV